jgi:23S rRNA (pseudouridine1915-N3)-methyltransferase
MQKLRLLSIGKNKEAWLDGALDEYVKRLKGTLAIEFVWLKNDSQLIRFVKNEPHVVCLDASGLLMNSIEFSQFLLKKLEQGRAHLTVAIGGAEGLPPVMKRQYPLISLSPLTFTHQLARLILMEQVYRAIAIDKGTPYHK